MKIKMGMVLTVWMAGLLVNPAVWARYIDEVAVSQDEVWKAAVEALKPFGLRKSDEGKKLIETKWIHDHVKRSNKLLRNIPKQEYERRYRMKVKLKDRAGDTVVEIKGIFQQRFPGIVQAPWNTVEPNVDDMDVEQEFFMKILKQMSNSRNQSAF